MKNKIKRAKHGHFAKGNVPWNKGIPMHLSPETEFKKGVNTFDKHPSWKGGVQRMKKDCVHVLVGTNERVRRPRKVYEEKIGPIPKGHIVFHKDGNKDNDKPKNLMTVSRANLLKINRNQKQDST